jgi:hypothetical protein
VGGEVENGGEGVFRHLGRFRWVLAREHEVMVGLASDLVARILGIADFQRGLITYEQLLQCGLDGHGIRRLCRRGWLRRVHRGVYLVGNAAPVPWRRETAAWLAFAPASVIVHTSSLARWGGCRANDELDVHVTVLGRRPPSRPGVFVHQVERIDPCDLGHCQRLPVSMPTRALLEAACGMDSHEYEKAVDEALALGLTDRQAVTRFTRRQVVYEPEYVIFRTGQEIGLATAKAAA